MRVCFNSKFWRKNYKAETKLQSRFSFVIFGAKISYKKVCVKCWWNWHLFIILFEKQNGTFYTKTHAPAHFQFTKKLVNLTMIQFHQHFMSSLCQKLPNQCVIKHIRAVQNTIIQKHFFKCFSNWPPNVAGIKTVNSFFWFVKKIDFCLFCLLSHAIQSILSKLTTFFFRSKKWIRNNIFRTCIALCRFQLCERICFLQFAWYYKVHFNVNSKIRFAIKRDVENHL